MTTALMKNIAGYALVASSVAPVASAAATINGASIDRSKHNMPLSAIMHTATGAETGAPTGVSVQSTLQHAPDNATWTNFLYDGSTTAQGAAITAVNTDQNYAVDLTLAQRYVRVQTVISFTGGTSPTVGLAAQLVLGGEQVVTAI
jgi:hypothetical protein